MGMSFRISSIMQGAQNLHKQIIDDLRQTCVSAITLFAESLIEKEHLFNHIHVYIVMDSETTSPIESQNCIVREKGGAWCEWQKQHPRA